MSLGLPEGSLTGVDAKNLDPETISLVHGLVEKVALVLSINEAWAMLAGFSALAALGVLLIRSVPAEN